MQTIDKSQSESVILVLNSGSSSLKFSLYYHGTTDEELILEGRAEAIGRDDGTFRIKLADGTTKWGASIDTNIELASIKAVLSAVNRAAK